MDKRYGYFFISVMVSVGLVVYLLNQIELSDLLQTLRHLYLPSVMIYGLLAVSGTIIRAYRYSVLIPPRSIRFSDLVWVTLVRNLFVDLIPARIGSFSYVYLINRRFGFPFEIAASSFIVAFLFDLIVLFPLFFLAIFWIKLPPDSLFSFSFILICVLLSIVIVVLFLFLAGIIRWGVRVGELLMKRFIVFQIGSIRLMFDKLRLTAGEIERIQKRKGNYIRMILSSFLLRGVKYSSLYFLLHAVLHQFGFLLQDLNFFKVFLGILGAELSSVLPVHGLAGFGTWESAWAFTFHLMGYFNSKLAILSGFSVHLTTQFFEYLLGLIALMVLYIPRKKEG